MPEETVRVDYWQRENAGSGLLGHALFNQSIETREVYHYLKSFKFYKRIRSGILGPSVFYFNFIFASAALGVYNSQHRGHAGLGSFQVPTRMSDQGLFRLIIS